MERTHLDRPYHLYLPRVFSKDVFKILARGFLALCLVYNCHLLKTRKPRSYQILLERPWNSAFYSKVIFFFIWTGMIKSCRVLPFKELHVASFKRDDYESRGPFKPAKNAPGCRESQSAAIIQMIFVCLFVSRLPACFRLSCSFLVNVQERLFFSWW